MILEGALHAASKSSRLMHASDNGMAEGREMIWLRFEGLEQLLQSGVPG